MKLIVALFLSLAGLSALAENYRIPPRPPRQPDGSEAFWERNPKLWAARWKSDQAAATAERMNGWPRQSPHTYHSRGTGIFDETGRWICNIP